MELRRELLWTIGALIVVNLSLALGAIGLFVRMLPAIEHILQENVYSVVAAEEILAELARAGASPVSPERQRHVRAALLRAKQNITEPEEAPVLTSIERSLPVAMGNDPPARARVVDELGEFLRINREAMQRVDLEAQRLGSAGAWATVLLGFLSFCMSLLVFARLQRRLLAPLVELHQVLDAAQEGERLRRCRAPNAPYEIVRVTESVNKLLDERLTEQRKESRKKRQLLEQLALTKLLERHPGGAAIVDSSGRLIRASKEMLELLAGDGGDNLRKALAGETFSNDKLERVPIDEYGCLVLLARQL